MDTASRLNNNPHFLSFSRKLFLSVMLLFLLFAGSIVMYQYQREKNYKVELLNTQLQDCNLDVYHILMQTPDSLQAQAIERYRRGSILSDLRITLITRQGKVLFDSKAGTTPINHLHRPEVEQALKEGTGYDVRRPSETLGGNYFYSATAFDTCIVRSALPYNLNLVRHLSTGVQYIWFTLIVALMLIIIFYQFTSRLGTAITQLRGFAMRADRDEPIQTDIQSAFPHNELGEISQHIVRIYRRLHETKEALYIEREKLITHLQSSREGLGIFTRQRREILVNDLFTRYANLISDSNLSDTEEIFAVEELRPVTAFIYAGKEGRTTLTVEKNGRIFAVECIMFQDLSFEVSINDITQEEEQVRLKRQLTQNIAHELKTPVSSIQGYLETLVQHPDIPSDKLHLFLERCYAQSNRLSRLLRDISVLTRMDEASEMIEIEPVNLTRLVAEILGEVSQELEAKQITVDNRLSGDIWVRGNHSLLYSIFRNLLDNAIAYGGTGIHIQLNCFRRDDRFYYFSFADNGTGVSPEHLHRLFERFYRVDKGRSRKLGGTGLGLAIVKNAVIFHGGTISAKHAPGGGLEFLFTLAKEKE
ncbi:MAG: two-component sensor histidine kinase [Prevotellaceae bacterium]|jgi:two-component system OmpR family sensor kinase/two-component system phosphate regulon sensor histidine kinase PhoR|nr:two-component sensor histidine kinase [Prevotellaceae bacterium]